jgi:hypothetical protein
MILTVITFHSAAFLHCNHTLFHWFILICYFCLTFDSFYDTKFTFFNIRLWLLKIELESENWCKKVVIYFITSMRNLRSCALPVFDCILFFTLYEKGLYIGLYRNSPRKSWPKIISYFWGMHDFSKLIFSYF